MAPYRGIYPHRRLVGLQRNENDLDFARLAGRGSVVPATRRLFFTALTLARRMCSARRCLPECSRESSRSVNGDVRSCRDRSREMSNRLCVLRWEAFLVAMAGGPRLYNTLSTVCQSRDDVTSFYARGQDRVAIHRQRSRTFPFGTWEQFETTQTFPRVDEESGRAQSRPQAESLYSLRPP